MASHSEVSPFLIARLAEPAQAQAGLTSLLHLKQATHKFRSDVQYPLLGSTVVGVWLIINGVGKPVAYFGDNAYWNLIENNYNHSLMNKTYSGNSKTFKIQKHRVQSVILNFWKYLRL